jgi:hypothetical protein
LLKKNADYKPNMSPEFPIRIITDDGECTVIDSPEELLEKVDSLDSADPHVWIRDALDRTVRLRMLGGRVELFSV